MDEHRCPVDRNTAVSGMEIAKAPERDDVEPIVLELRGNIDLADKLIGPLLEKEAAYWDWWGRRVARHEKVTEEEAAARAYIELSRVYQQIALAPIEIDIALEMIRLQNAAELKQEGASGNSYDAFLTHTDKLLEEALETVMQHGRDGKYGRLWEHAEYAAAIAHDALFDNQELLGMDLIDIEGTPEAYLKLSLISNREISTSVILMESIGLMVEDKNITPDELSMALRDGFLDSTAWQRANRPAFFKALFGRLEPGDLLTKASELAHDGLSIWAKAVQECAQTGNTQGIAECISGIHSVFLDPSSTVPATAWQGVNAGRCHARFNFKMSKFEQRDIDDFIDSTNIQLFTDNDSETYTTNTADVYHGVMLDVIERTLLEDEEFFAALKIAANTLKQAESV